MTISDSFHKYTTEMEIIDYPYNEYILIDKLVEEYRQLSERFRKEVKRAVLQLHPEMVQSLIVREDNLELDIQKVPAKFIVEAFEFLSLPISHELQIILEESEIRRAYHTLYTDN